MSGKEKSESDNEQSSDNFQKSASRRRDIVNKRRLGLHIHVIISYIDFLLYFQQEVTYRKMMKKTYKS